MDISVNERVEKVKLRDIFAGLKDIFIGNNNSIEDDKLNKEIEEIRKVESEIGASTSIKALENQIQEHSFEKAKRKSSAKIQTKKPEIKEETKIIEDEERDR